MLRRVLSLVPGPLSEGVWLVPGTPESTPAGNCDVCELPAAAGDGLGLGSGFADCAPADSGAAKARLTARPASQIPVACVEGVIEVFRCGVGEPVYAAFLATAFLAAVLAPGSRGARGSNSKLTLPSFLS